MIALHALTFLSRVVEYCTQAANIYLHTGSLKSLGCMKLPHGSGDSMQWYISSFDRPVTYSSTTLKLWSRTWEGKYFSVDKEERNSQTRHLLPRYAKFVLPGSEIRRLAAPILRRGGRGGRQVSKQEKWIQQYKAEQNVQCGKHFFHAPTSLGSQGYSMISAPCYAVTQCTQHLPCHKNLPQPCRREVAHFRRQRQMPSVTCWKRRLRRSDSQPASQPAWLAEVSSASEVWRKEGEEFSQRWLKTTNVLLVGGRTLMATAPFQRARHFSVCETMP